MELIILAVPLVLLWLMVSRGRKQQRELVAQQDSVKVGTRVMTTSGLYAEVVEVENEAVVLEIAAGVRTRWSKRAIGQVITTDLDGGTPDEVATGVVDLTDGPAGPAGPAGHEDIRSEAGYAAPPNAEGTSGTTGTTGTDGR